MSMVRSSRQMAGQALAQGQPGAKQCASDGQPGALHQFPCGRESDATLLRTCQSVATEGFVITARMNPFEIPPRNAHGALKL